MQLASMQDMYTISNNIMYSNEFKRARDIISLTAIPCREHKSLQALSFVQFTKQKMYNVPSEGLHSQRQVYNFYSNDSHIVYAS